MGKKLLKDFNLLVTPTSFSRYDKNLINNLERTVKSVTYNKSGKPLTEEELIPLVGEIDGFIAGLDDITKKVIKNARNLKVISRYGTGVDNVDLKAAEEAGIYVTNTPGANSVSVAELTIGLALITARNILEGNKGTKAGGWPRLKGITLSGKTFGIIGLGRVGKEVAKRLSNFDINILAYDIHFDSEFGRKNNVKYTELDRLLASSDFISLHLTVSKDTNNIINEKNLKKIKKGSILINTSRGELIDENALFESLKNGHLEAAALDTFRKEPPEPDNKLLSLPNVIATPHLGATTEDASNKMTRISIDECLAVLKGVRPKHIVVEPQLQGNSKFCKE